MAYEEIINWTLNYLREGRTAEELSQHLLKYNYTHEQVIYILTVAKQRLREPVTPAIPEPAPAPEVPKPAVPAPKAPKPKIDKKVISIIAVIIIAIGSFGTMYFAGFFGGAGNQSTETISEGAGVSEGAGEEAAGEAGEESPEIVEGTALSLEEAFASDGAKCEIDYGEQDIVYWIKSSKVRMESATSIAIYLADKSYLYDSDAGWSTFPAVETDYLVETINEIINLGGTVNCYTASVDESKFNAPV